MNRDRIRLDRLIEEDRYNIEYKIVKINFDNTNEQKNQIIQLFKQGYMAIIHVGPSENSPLTFSKKDSFNFLFVGKVSPKTISE